MFTLSDFQNAIEEQLLHNRNKSLFYKPAHGRPVLHPSPQTAELLKRKAREISVFAESAKADGSYRQLLLYVSDKTVRLFREVNQYLDFRLDDYRKLETIYEELLEQVRLIGHQKDISERDLERLLSSHYNKLQSFLIDSNGTEIFKKYREHPDLFEIACAEYTPEFQMKLLQLRPKSMKQPVLDVGCGRQAGFVRFLRNQGIEAYGMDRDNAEPSDFIWRMNWHEAAFPPNTWGTIVSHMAFSNHFSHHHMKPDGDFEGYARKYMEILHSLKLGGSFVYAPGLPFIEKLLRSSNNAFAAETGEYYTKVSRLR